jgi:hypothetical protein
VKANILLSLLLAGTFGASLAQADESTSATTSVVNSAAVVQKDEAMKDNDEITNARLKATLGSKSKWSVKTALGYSGGSIDRPVADVRPAYRAGPNRPELPQLAGTVGVNYRPNDKDNVSVNTGVLMMNPLYGNIGDNAPDGRNRKKPNATIERYQVSTPSLDWSRGYKALGMQMVSEATYSHYTTSDTSDINAIGDIAISQTLLADLGTSKWQGGLNLLADVTLYGGGIKNGDVAADYESGAYKRDDGLLALYPFAEYSFNDTYSFRTVFGYFEFIHYRDEFGNPSGLGQREPYQSVGIGISVTRDIYLYPNIQFAPKDVRSDRTNVALSTNINLF